MRSPGSNIDLEVLVKLVRNRLNKNVTHKINIQILKTDEARKKLAKQQQTKEEKEQEKEAIKEAKLQNIKSKRNAQILAKQRKKTESIEEKKMLEKKKTEVMKKRVNGFLDMNLEALKAGANLPLLRGLLQHYVNEGKLSNSEIQKVGKLKALQLIKKARA